MLQRLRFLVAVFLIIEHCRISGANAISATTMITPSINPTVTMTMPIIVDTNGTDTFHQRHPINATIIATTTTTTTVEAETEAQAEVEEEVASPDSIGMISKIVQDDELDDELDDDLDTNGDESHTQSENVINIIITTQRPLLDINNDELFTATMRNGTITTMATGNGGDSRRPLSVNTPIAPKLYKKYDQRKKKMEKKSILIQPDLVDWKCPNITRNRNLECACDMPHTLRCSGDIHGLEQIADGLRKSAYSVSLLDCTLKNVTFLSDARIFENVSLHGLVISSGEIKRVHRSAFLGINSPLQALGLPNNALGGVPWNSLSPLTQLDRLDLSNNRIKALGTVDFIAHQKLTYLELSENLISSISLRSFTPLRKLVTLKLNGNRLGDFAASLEALSQCFNLRELDLKSNSIKGPLSQMSLPPLSVLESLNLDRNLLTSVQNGALQGFPYLITLSLRHNQIDVLQDHAFSGLSNLQRLDLGYNGIVAVSGASLQHLPRLLVLDLTHNFLRALTADLIAPLQSLKELRLDGNDISIVARNALDGAKELHSLSLQENPLSCDCTLRPFAEWLAQSKIPSQDLLGAVCATPPHLEGAPLLQIPVESLNCDSNDNEYDNANILEQLEAISKQNNLSHIKDFSDVITLRDLHYSNDYGLILTWIVNLKSEEFTCDAVFVYKETNIHEILLDNSPIHCDISAINDANVVSVALQDSSSLEMGNSYRFCLVLLQERNAKTDLVVGCSNITKFEMSASTKVNVAKKPHQLIDTLITSNRISTQLHATGEQFGTFLNDVSSFDKIARTHSHEVDMEDRLLVDVWQSKAAAESANSGGGHNVPSSRNRTFDFIGSMAYNKSFLPGLAVGILITSVFALVWGATKIRRRHHHRTATPSVSTCYAASSDGGMANVLDTTENRNRYFKLQATTSL